MAIDLKNETIIDLKRQAGAYVGIGRNGKPPHYSFFLRAVLKGTNGHRLEALKVGSRWITSVEALQRWMERQTPAGATTTPGRPAADRRRAAERAERELDRLGF